MQGRKPRIGKERRRDILEGRRKQGRKEVNRNGGKNRGKELIWGEETREEGDERRLGNEETREERKK